MRCYSLKFALALGVFLFSAVSTAQAQCASNAGTVTQTEIIAPAAAPTIVEQVSAPIAAPCETTCTPAPTCVRKIKNVTYEDKVLPAKVKRIKQVSYVECPVQKTHRVKQVSYLECPYTKVHRVKQVSYVECPETKIHRKRQVSWLECSKTVMERKRQVAYTECAGQPRTKRIKHVSWTACAEPAPVATCAPVVQTCAPVVNTCAPLAAPIAAPAFYDDSWYSTY